MNQYNKCINIILLLCVENVNSVEIHRTNTFPLISYAKQPRRFAYSKHLLPAGYQLIYLCMCVC